MSDLLIAEVLREHRIVYLDQFICAGCKQTFTSLGETDAHQAEKIMAAVYPRIETQEALLDLPINALLIDDDGDVYAMREFVPVLLTGWSGVRYDPPALPAILIWSPEVQP
ncbi:hypothetical protein [Mycobacteroides abscessus]|uniref:hypothetical protein n=1 Tax=Mycobacteroides abscessus TaxID=36809 RepID=UPI00189647C2|nr:hypothetical protein [Mycobacteroides abscessus]